jgi:pilus assembly protein CpaB
VLLALAIACGGLAASRVQTRESQVEAAVGPLVPVVVTRTEVPPDTSLKAAQLAVRHVPARFAPRDALVSAQQVMGQSVPGGLTAGAYVTAGALAAGRPSPDPGAAGAPIRRGERSAEVAVAGGEALGAAPPGTRVDVIVTTEPPRGRTFLALQDVELLGAKPAPAAAATDARADTVATLRVTLREAVLLTAAQSFAREIRLLTRAPGDKRTAHPLTVEASGL